MTTPSSPYRDALLLIRSAIHNDQEAIDIVIRYGDHDRLIRWLTALGVTWLRSACGLRHLPDDEVTDYALRHLAVLGDGELWESAA